MSPPAAEVDTQSTAPAVQPVTKTVEGVKSSSASRLDGPLSNTGSLDGEEQFDVTAVIGREFPKLQLTEILKDDDKLRDLAVLGMHRPVTARKRVVLILIQFLSEVLYFSATRISTLMIKSTSDRSLEN